MRAEHSGRVRTSIQNTTASGPDSGGNKERKFWKGLVDPKMITVPLYDDKVQGSFAEWRDAMETVVDSFFLGSRAGTGTVASGEKEGDREHLQGCQSHSLEQRNHDRVGIPCSQRRTGRVSPNEVDRLAQVACRFSEVCRSDGDVPRPPPKV